MEWVEINYVCICSWSSKPFDYGYRRSVKSYRLGKTLNNLQPVSNWWMDVWFHHCIKKTKQWDVIELLAMAWFILKKTVIKIILQNILPPHWNVRCLKFWTDFVFYTNFYNKLILVLQHFENIVLFFQCVPPKNNACSAEITNLGFIEIRTWIK